MRKNRYKRILNSTHLKNSETYLCQPLKLESRKPDWRIEIRNRKPTRLENRKPEQKTPLVWDLNSWLTFFSLPLTILEYPVLLLMAKLYLRRGGYSTLYRGEKRAKEITTLKTHVHQGLLFSYLINSISYHNKPIFYFIGLFVMESQLVPNTKRGG